MLQIVENTGKFSANCICNTCRNEYVVKNRYDAKKSRVGHICNKCKTTISQMGKVTQEKLQNAFNYDQNTGLLTHKKDTLSGSCGDIATSDNCEGYLELCVNRKRLLAHRAIFMYMTGRFPNQIDHINHARKDNRWCNLRDVKHRENQLNTSLSKNSTTKVNGVSFHRQSGKYRAYIMVNSKHIHLGMFDKLVDAEHARLIADKKYMFHNNHGR